MKVVHLNTYDILGGASRAAFGIFKSISRNDVKPKMLVQKKFGTNQNVFNLSDSWFSNQINKTRVLLDLLPIYLFTHRSKGRFSFAKVGINILKYEIIQEADILHFHWINGGFLSLKNLYEISNFNKPIFWTLHDMWPFTGGCHYAGNCESYTNSCGFCPYLKQSSSNDSSYKIISKKKQIIKNLNLNIVTPSRWMKGCAEKSSLFKNLKVELVPYAIDIDLFKPQNKEQARSEFKLPKDKTLILFGSMNIEEERKGFKYFKESLVKILSKNPDLKNKIAIVVFGRADSEMQSGISFDLIFCGRIESDKKMISLYNAADFFVTSALEDNYPNTVMESLSCGTPVLAFDIGGIPDMVNHFINGYLADVNSDSLATGMEWMINNKEIWPKLCTHAREGIVKINSPKIIGEKYFQLYKKALE